MTDARGRARRGATRATNYTREGEMLRNKWDKLTDDERAVWNYMFERYKKAHQANA